MRSPVKLSVVGLILVLVTLGACNGPGAPSGVQTVDRRECPHDWPERLTFSNPDAAGGQVTVSASFSGPDTILNVPEFHDCQRFLVRNGPDLRYDSLFAIFATTRLPATDSVGEDGGGLPAAEIVAWNRYEWLNIELGFNCLYLVPKAPQGQDGGWAAWMVPFGTTEQDCSQSVRDPSQLPGAASLRVVAYTDSRLGGAEDYPMAARWDWDDNRGRHYIGIRCGEAWCGVGETGFTPSRAYSESLPTPPSQTATYRVMRVKGWYDEQILAGRPAPDGTPIPSGIVGTLLPDPLLATRDSAAFKGSWVTTAYAALRVPAGVENIYEAKYNFTATNPGASLDGLNQIALCHGSRTDCSVPASAGTCGDGMWWGRVANADPADTTVRYFCVTHYPVNMTIPGIVRWRWVVDDEGEWMRCPQGCCELVA